MNCLTINFIDFQLTNTVKIMLDYLGGEVDLKEFDRTTADDAIRPAAEGGIPLGPLLVGPS